MQAGHLAPFQPAPREPDAAALHDARFLSLTLVPQSAAACALVRAATTQAAAHEAERTNQRREAGQAKLRTAVGAIVGGLLHRWSGGTPTLAFRSRANDAFSSGPVGARQFRAVMDALIRAGLVGQKAGIAFLAEGWDADSPSVPSYLAGRYWPTAALLSLAEAHGISPGNVRQAFRSVPPTKPPVVKYAVELRALGAGPRDPTAGRVLPIPPDDARAAAIRADVEAHNAMAERWEVTGCLPPRWRRVFRGGWRLSGRWYAAGADGNYQTMPEPDRVGAIRLNGEPVVEIDVQAAHLSIVSALAGAPLVPGADPYAMPGVPREVVKKWIVATLGKGSPVIRAPRGSGAFWTTHRPHEVARAVIARHPVLGRPAEVVPDSLAEQHGDARHLLPHYLAGIEAAALTDAMRTLREAHGVLSLPMHDGLIAPKSAEEVAKAALVDGFERLAGFTPGVA